jgi:hypothetical protein
MSGSESLLRVARNDVAPSECSSAELIVSIVACQHACVDELFVVFE